jgi:hypothetical protein
MITHLEMSMAKVIRRGNEGINWMTKLSPGRQEKIQLEIARSKAEDSLVDYLLFTQFADKVTIIRGDDRFVGNKNDFSEQMRSVQSLRDNLAHANEFASTRAAAVGVCATVRIIDRWISQLNQWAESGSLG